MSTGSTLKTFAWKHAIAFGSVVPRLKIRLFNAITNGILDTDDSITQTGTWQKSTDGGKNWSVSKAINGACYFEIRRNHLCLLK